MGSYKPVPQTENEKTMEDQPNDEDFDFNFVPKCRKSWDLGILFFPIISTTLEIFFFNFLFNDYETLGNIATCSLAFSYARLVYTTLRFFDNFDRVCVETHLELFIWSAKLIITCTLIWFFNVPAFKEHLLTFIFIFICSLIFLCKIKTWSWPEICEYSNKHPDLGASLAHGTFEGYYIHILPEFRKHSDEFCKKNSVPLKKLIILLPQSCSSMQTLLDNDSTVEQCEVLMTIPRDNGGTLGREYKIPIFKVQRQDSNGEFYCFFDMPSSLKNLKLIAATHSENQEYLEEQYENFVQFLRECLKNDAKCKDNYLLVPYNDLKMEEDNYKLPLSKILEFVVDGKMHKL